MPVPDSSCLGLGVCAPPKTRDAHVKHVPRVGRDLRVGDYWKKGRRTGWGDEWEFIKVSSLILELVNISK